MFINLILFCSEFHDPLYFTFLNHTKVSDLNIFNL